MSYLNENPSLNEPEKSIRALMRSNFSIAPSCDWGILYPSLCKAKLFSHFMYAAECKSFETPKLPAEFLIRRIMQKKRFLAIARTGAIVQSMLRSKGIKSVIIKGCGLSQTIYGSLFARQYNDVDILVSSDSFLPADTALKSIGAIQVPSRSQALSHEEFERAKRQPQTSFPLKNRPDSIQALPYYFNDNGDIVRIELHEGVRHLPSCMVEDIIESRQYVELDDYTSGIAIPSSAYQFALLLLTTFDNSESRYANLTGDKISLQDYADLQCFIEKNCGSIDWILIANLADKLEDKSIIGTVFANLHELTHKEFSSKVGAIFPSRNRTQSIWDDSIMNRIFRSDDCRRNALRIERQCLLSRADAQPIMLSSASADKLEPDLSFVCIANSLFYALSISGATLSIHLAIKDPKESLRNKALAISLIPGLDEIGYLHLTVFTAYHSSKITAVGNTSVKPLIRPTFDKKQLMFDVTEESNEATGILSAVITIPDFIHEIKRFESTPLFISASLFEKQFDNIYYPVIGTGDSLIDAHPLRMKFRDANVSPDPLYHLSERTSEAPAKTLL